MTQDARPLAAEARAALRLRAWKAVRSGTAEVEAAQVFGMSRQGIAMWLGAYARGGAAALRPHKRGPGNPAGKLKAKQEAVTRNLICDRHPEQLKLPFVLWASDAVRQLLRRHFQVRPSSCSVRRYLKQWGFIHQKPRRVAYERDSAEVSRYLQEAYPVIRARAKRENALVF